jgi:hypothetical protein
MNAEKARVLGYDDFRRYAADLKPETRMCINGELVDTHSGDRFDTVNPANGQVLASIPALANGSAPESASSISSRSDFCG